MDFRSFAGLIPIYPRIPILNILIKFTITNLTTMEKIHRKSIAHFNLLPSFSHFFHGLFGTTNPPERLRRGEAQQLRHLGSRPQAAQQGAGAGAHEAILMLQQICRRRKDLRAGGRG